MLTTICCDTHSESIVVSDKGLTDIVKRAGSIADWHYLSKQPHGYMHMFTCMPTMDRMFNTREMG